MGLGFSVPDATVEGGGKHWKSKFPTAGCGVMCVFDVLA